MASKQILCHFVVLLVGIAAVCPSSIACSEALHFPASMERRKSGRLVRSLNQYTVLQFRPMLYGRSPEQLDQYASTILDLLDSKDYRNGRMYGVSMVGLGLFRDELGGKVEPIAQSLAAVSEEANFRKELIRRLIPKLSGRPVELIELTVRTLFTAQMTDFFVGQQLVPSLQFLREVVAAVGSVSERRRSESLEAVADFFVYGTIDQLNQRSGRKPLTRLVGENLSDINSLQHKRLFREERAHYFDQILDELIEWLKLVSSQTPEQTQLKAAIENAIERLVTYPVVDRIEKSQKELEGLSTILGVSKEESGASI